ncbi:MAG TPA: tautomerase family protein [Candidatus Sulfotelmatobacter sp.]|nr:tautomerase family protein [Candidatus Sulfotelmatobacter sp.]
MPFVQIHTSRPVGAQTRDALGRALAAAYGEHMRTTQRIVNVGFVHYAPGELVRYDADDGGSREMTIVTCAVRGGRTPAMLEALGRAITDACARELGIDAARVAVYLDEHPAHTIYRDGGVAPAWSAAERDAAERS